MNFLTESLDLPQNEQRKCLSWDMAMAAGGGGVSEPVRTRTGSQNGDRMATTKRLPEN